MLQSNLLILTVQVINLFFLAFQVSQLKKNTRRFNGSYSNKSPRIDWKHLNYLVKAKVYKNLTATSKCYYSHCVYLNLSSPKPKKVHQKDVRTHQSKQRFFLHILGGRPNCWLRKVNLISLARGPPFANILLYTINLVAV